MISYLSSSAHFFLMFRTVVSSKVLCRATEKEDLLLFTIWITSLSCPIVIRFRLEEGDSPVDLVVLDRFMMYRGGVSRPSMSACLIESKKD